MYPVRNSQAEITEHQFLMQGNGTSAPTMVVGPAGAVVTRTGVGVWRITYAGTEAPGRVVGFQPGGFLTATPTGLAGFSLVADSDSYAGSALLFDVTVCNASNAAADLTTADYVSFSIKYAQIAAVG